MIESRPDESPTSETAEANLLSWLAKQGYPLELRVGKVFREAGWYIEHAPWYLDPETGKPREVDLRAEVSAVDKRKKISAHLTLVVECKSSTGKPWVMFATEANDGNRIYLDYPVVGLCSRAAMHAVMNSNVVEPEFLQLRDRIGHGVVRAYTENKGGDPTSPYAAIRGVLNAATAVAADTDPGGIIDVVMPVIVLDGKLFDYGIDQAGVEKISEIEVAQLAAPDTLYSISSGLACVTVVTSAALKRWVEEITVPAIGFCSAMLPHMDIVMSYHQMFSKE